MERHGEKRNLSSWNEFLMSLAATTVSIILTFGTTAITTYDGLASFNSSPYLFYSQTQLHKMQGEYEQCKLMMKVKDKDLEVFSTQRQKLQDTTKGSEGADEMGTLLQELKQRNYQLQKAREEGKKAL